MKAKVENMRSARGNTIANQFIIHIDGARYFQSYRSVIAKIENGRVTLDREKWDYSVTTGKYRNQFLGESKAETERKIKAGLYDLADLN